VLWFDVGSVSQSSALLLTSTDALRFVPDGLNSDSASVGFRAWDQSTGSAASKVDVTSNGGTTAFSTTEDLAAINVLALNDAPVMTISGPTLTTITEDEITNPGDRIDTWLT